MVKKYLRRLTVLLVLLLTVLPIQTLAATELNSPYTNLSASFDGSGSGSAYAGTVSMTVEGARTSAKNGTLTLTNSGSEAAMLSFSYAASGTYSSFTVAGSNASTSGSYSAELAAGSSITIVMSVAKSGLLTSPYSASVTLTNVKLEVASTANVTISHNELGTTSVGGTTVSSGSTVEVDATGATFAATPASGAEFVGWINTADNSVVSTAASFTYVPTGDASLKAIFASATHEACFWGSGKSYLFESLSAAVNHATSASNKTIILAANGTLSSGGYTIPSGVTLLIPFDSAGTCYTTSPGYDESTWSKPSAFSTLTMASGANITVNGAISVSAKVSAKMGYAGAPTSKYGHVAMNEGGSITVNSGGNLYAWGYITGSGNVTIKSGATVYESFQVVDWRGGTASSGMLNNSNKVFPMTQYFVQNVEAPMTLEYGASEQCSMVADIISVRQVTVKFLGTSGCMFNLKSGSVTKWYDGSTDRLVLEFDGELSLSKTEIDLILSYSIATEKYVLPLTNNMTINIHDGSTVTLDQTTSLLPGVQMTIDEEGTVKLGSGTQLFVYDETEWKSNYFVYSNAYFRPVRYAPGQTYTRTNADIVDAKIVVNGTLDASEGYLYTTTSGANICSTGNGVVKVQAAEASPTLYEATQSGTSISYASISITPAKLKNSDDSYTKTATYGAGTYYYIDGYWHYNTHEHVVGSDGTTCTYCPAVVVAQTNVLVDDTTTAKKFFSLQEAIKNTSNGFITMLADTTENTYTINKAVTIDLNKFDVTVGGATATVTCIDSGTNGFQSVPGTNLGSINVAAVAPTEAVNGKYYIAITADGVTTFHRVAVAVTSCQFIYDGLNDAEYIVVQGTFKGTDQSVAKLTDLGFSFTDTGSSTAGTANLAVPSDTNYNGATWSYYYGRDFDSTVSDGVTVQALMEFSTRTTPIMSNMTEDLVALYQYFLNNYVPKT